MLALCGLALLAARQARAQQGEDDVRAARELFQRAEQRFQAKDYAAALALYQQAYQRKPLPGFHFNIGQCHRHLGNHDQAIRHFRLYLASSEKPRHRRAAEQLIAVCERERQRPGSRSSAPGAAASAPDGGAPAAAAAPATQAVQEAPAAPRKRYKPIHFWAAAGVSAALLLTSAISAIMTLQKSLEFNDPDTDYNRLSTLQSSGVTLRTTSIVTLALGALGAAGSTWLYFRTDFGAARATVTAAPLGDDGGGLLVTGSF